MVDEKPGLTLVPSRQTNQPHLAASSTWPPALVHIPSLVAGTVSLSSDWSRCQRLSQHKGTSAFHRLLSRFVYRTVSSLSSSHERETSREKKRQTDGDRREAGAGIPSMRKPPGLCL